jgi:hypothetical protein
MWKMPIKLAVLDTYGHRYAMNYAFVALLLLLPVTAHAMDKQTAIYDVYASGVHVLEAQLDLTEDAGRYDMSFTAHTRGFLAALLPWTGTYVSQGWLENGNYIPELHKSHTVWKDEVDGKEYHYTKEGGLQELIVTEKGKTKKQEVDPALSKDTIDAYSAALKVLAKVAASGACEGKNDIFDDKRRFTQIFHSRNSSEMQSTEYNIHTGPAAVCEVEVVPNGGKWHKKPRGWMNVQEQGRRLGALPTMWAAKLNENGPAVPVKIMIKTDYGTLLIHLAEYRNGDKILKADKRKKK